MAILPSRSYAEDYLPKQNWVINKANPLTRGLVGMFVLNDGNDDVYNFVTRDRVPVSGSAHSWLHEGFWGGTEAAGPGGFPMGPGTDEGAVVLHTNVNALYDWNTLISQSGSGNDLEMWVYATGVVAARYWNTDSRVESAAISTGKVVVGYGWKRNTFGSGNKLYLNGDLKASTTSANNAIPAGNIHLGPAQSSNEIGNNITRVAMLYDRQIGDHEHALLYANPYQVLKPVNDLEYFPTASAGGGVTAYPAAMMMGL